MTRIPEIATAGGSEVQMTSYPVVHQPGVGQPVYVINDITGALRELVATGNLVFIVDAYGASLQLDGCRSDMLLFGKDEGTLSQQYDAAQILGLENQVAFIGYPGQMGGGTYSFGTEPADSSQWLGMGH